MNPIPPAGGYSHHLLKQNPLNTKGFICDRVGIRTPNLLIRSEMLYPVELHNQSKNWSANILILLKLQTILNEFLCNQPLNLFGIIENY